MAIQFHQREITIGPVDRGIHLVTSQITQALPEMVSCRVGTLQVFIKHTSASLTINENASPDVRSDLNHYLDELVPDGYTSFRHTAEGPDDMPAHVKASMLGSSLTIPVSDGRLRLGTWQGVYLCEHRNRGGARNVVLTLQGDFV